MSICQGSDSISGLVSLGQVVCGLSVPPVWPVRHIFVQAHAGEPLPYLIFLTLTHKQTWSVYFVYGEVRLARVICLHPVFSEAACEKPDDKNVGGRGVGDEKK